MALGEGYLKEHEKIICPDCGILVHALTIKLLALAVEEHRKQAHPALDKP